MPAIGGGAARKSGIACLNRVDQRSETLDADFQAVTGLNRANATGRAGQNNVARQQGQAGGNKAHQLKAVEKELARIRILPKLAVLVELDL